MRPQPATLNRPELPDPGRGGWQPWWLVAEVLAAERPAPRRMSATTRRVDSLDRTVAASGDPIDSACDIIVGHVRCAKGIRTTRYDQRPEAGSVGAVDLADQARFASGWIQPPVEVFVSLAALYLEAAEDHLVGLTRVARPPQLIAAPFTTARGMLEAAARAWLLLDPTVTVEERIARGVNERLYGLREKAKDDPEFAKYAAVQSAALLAGATRVGMPLTKHGDWVLKGRAENTKLVDQLVSSLEPSGDASVYRFYTAIAHAVLGGLAFLLVPDEERPGAAKLDLTRTDLFNVIALCVLCHETVFDRALDYLGWTEPQWASWKSHAHEVLVSCQERLRAHPDRESG
jgi:hypothetical protein